MRSCPEDAIGRSGSELGAGDAVLHDASISMKSNIGCDVRLARRIRTVWAVCPCEFLWSGNYWQRVEISFCRVRRQMVELLGKKLIF
jgi:hypothetical protein